jgi:type VI secretion system protein ImpL
VDDVNGLFRKPDGALWTLYDPALQKLLVKQGSSYVPSPNGGAVLTPAFVNFFNQAAALSEALYAGNSKDPHFAYSLKALPFVGFTNLGITLVIDGQTLKYTGGQAAPQKFVWTPAEPHEYRSTLQIGGESADLMTGQGLWAVFHFFEQAERSLPAESGSGQVFEWPLKVGKGPMTVNGKPVTMRFQVDMIDMPPVFQKGFFSRMGCVAEVARP